MLIACRLAGLSALDEHYPGLTALPEQAHAFLLNLSCPTTGARRRCVQTNSAAVPGRSAWEGRIFPEFRAFGEPMANPGQPTRRQAPPAML